MKNENEGALYKWYEESTKVRSEIMPDLGIEVLPPDIDHNAVMKSKTEYLDLKIGRPHKSFIVMVPVLFSGIFE